MNTDYINLMSFLDKPYSSYNDEAKKQVDHIKYFTGSHDELGYYEPELTDYLIDKKARCGRFTSIKPYNKNYFEYWYNSECQLIKIKHININDEYESYDVFVQNLDSDIFYVFFDYRNPNLDVMLSNIFALKFDNDRLTSLKKYIKDCYTQHIRVRESEYKYQNDKLVSAEIYDDFQHYEFSFFYRDDGSLNSYLLKIGVNEYTGLVDIKTIKRFEKFGLFHFS